VTNTLDFALCTLCYFVCRNRKGNERESVRKRERKRVIERERERVIERERERMIERERGRG